MDDKQKLLQQKAVSDSIAYVYGLRDDPSAVVGDQAERMWAEAFVSKAKEYGLSAIYVSNDFDMTSTAGKIIAGTMKMYRMPESPRFHVMDRPKYNRPCDKKAIGNDRSGPRGRWGGLK